MSQAQSDPSARTREASAAAARTPGRLQQWTNRWQALRRVLSMREENLFLLLAVVIGLCSGLLVVCFRIAIDWTHLWLLRSSQVPPPLRVILAPTVAGFGVAFLAIVVFKSVRGSGVNQTKAAVYIYDGYIPFNTVIGKFITCALAIGSGQSLGPEDPSLQIGAGFASLLGRKLELSREKVRLIAPVGAAAGLAAAFNAPISAVLFVIEEVIGNWSAGVLGAVVLSAVSSVVILRGFLGGAPLFRIPPVQLVHPSELLAYAVLGVAGGGASLLFTQLIAYFRPRLQNLPKWTYWVQPAAAGLLVGIIGLRFPQVMGAGYAIIDQAMHNQYVWQMLAILAALKILATTISFVSGTPGGMFAPTLFIGAMLGGAVGAVEHHFFPSLSGSLGAYCLVGMGTLFAGFLRVPMTSVFMVLEVSGNYSVIIPVMISNTIAYLISRKYQKVPLFDMLSRQDGTDLPSIEEQREESLKRVEDAMRRPGVVLQGNATVAEAMRAVEKSPEDHFLVRLGNGGWSSMDKGRLAREIRRGNGAARLATLPSLTRLPCLHPDQPLYMALRQISDWPVLPVVHRADAQHLEGMISLDDILKSYHAAFQKIRPSEPGAEAVAADEPQAVDVHDFPGGL